MTAYKDEVRGTWYVSFHYYDWTGKNKRKLKRGFKTRKEALEWEHNFKVKEADGIDMTVGEFFELYTSDMKPKLKLNAWKTKETIVNGILYWCGLRVGELLALTAKDIDIGNKVIHVTKSFQRIDGKDVVTEPKTQKGIRDVAIPDFLVEELKTYLSRLYGFYETDRIFPVVRSYYNKEIERGAKKAGVKRIRVHDLRHSHVSLLISLGFPAVLIANRVGHESATVTYRYAHMFPTEQTRMADKLNQSYSAVITEKEEN